MRGDEFFLEDIGSRNGTAVNRQQIEGRVKLVDNDEIQFGGARACFLNPADEPLSLGSSPPTVNEALATLDLRADQVSLGETTEAKIMGEVSGGDRLGALDLNPEAKLRAVLDISDSLAGTVDLAALLPKILL